MTTSKHSRGGKWILFGMLLWLVTYIVISALSSSYMQAAMSGNFEAMSAMAGVLQFVAMVYWIVIAISIMMIIYGIYSIISH